MARIEISLEEYNGLKSKIDALGQTIHDVTKENNKFKELLDKVEYEVYKLNDSTITERLFKWKSIFKPLADIFGLDEEKNSEEKQEQDSSK